MARAAWWIPVLQMAWFVSQAGTERGGESARQEAQSPHTPSYEAGQTATLYCSVDNLGDRTVTWRKLPNRNPLTIGRNTWVKDPRIHAEHVPNSSQWNLVIERVNATDAGTYECQVSARGQQFRHRVELIVKALPARRYPKIEISGRNFIRQGETIQLQCNASMVDITTDNLEWLRNDNPLRGTGGEARVRIYTSVSPYNQHLGSISSKLEIRDARVGDSGTYVCRSTERSQLAGVRLEVKPDTLNSKRENIQQYTGSSSGHPGYHYARAIVIVTVISAVTSIFCAWDVR
ncbi:lachesin-like isoform X2 [Littorina saxatilis]|uniref:lachesin-like isoform X2 n=1 Tax=Littorina saxatilis TaxID=31220 RepID=UPI0038B64AF4